MKIYITSDHAGYELKVKIAEYLKDKGYDFSDLGPFSDESVNWAEWGAKAAEKVSASPEESRGIVVCGSGIGMSIVCNKFRNVRAALCSDVYTAEMTRRHNNSNILNIGARVVEEDIAMKIVETWLETPFDGGRHLDRINYVSEVVENKNFK